MLILTRKIGETIRIAGNIRVTVMEVDGRNVKLGIDAPKEVAIYREEVFARILEENRNAAENQKLDLSSMADLLKKPGEGKKPEGGPPPGPAGKAEGNTAPAGSQPPPGKDEAKKE